MSEKNKEKKTTIQIQIIKRSNPDNEKSERDTDAPLMNAVAEKFKGKVVGNYKGGSYKSVIDTDIELPEEIKEIRIKKIKPREKKDETSLIKEHLQNRFFNGIT